MLNKTDSKFLSSAKLITTLSFIWGLLIVLFLLSGGVEIIEWFFEISISNWIWFIVPLLLVNPIIQTLQTRNVHEDEFSRNVRSGIGARLASRLTAISYGLIAGSGTLGLIFADLIQNLILLITLRPLRFILRLVDSFKSFNVSRIVAIAREFKNYPLMVFPARWVNLISGQIPIVIFAKYFSPGHTGTYTLAVSLLELPVNLLAQAIRPVFYKRALDLYDQDKELLKTFTLRIYYYFLIAGSIIVAVLFSFGPELFGLIFGSEWRQSGDIAALLSFSYLFILISSPFGSLRRIFRKEQHILYANLLLLLMRGFLIPYSWITDDFQSLVIFYSIMNGLFYLINTVLILSLITKNVLIVILQTVFIFAIIILIFSLIKTGLQYYSFILDYSQ